MENIRSHETVFAHLMDKLEDLLLQCWRETGYGTIAIESERINQEKIRVFIRGSIHYKYVLTDKDVREALALCKCKKLGTR